jgi:predicted nucleotidyltransferase
VEGYDDLARGATEVDLDGTTVQLVSLEDLIRMKRAAGRAKDRAELEILEALRSELET